MFNYEQIYELGQAEALTKLGMNDAIAKRMMLATKARQPMLNAIAAQRQANPLGIIRSAPSTNPAHVAQRNALNTALSAIEQRASVPAAPVRQPGTPPPIPAAALRR